jgi:catechol 2,3-dioxygenase-like lactoylglutathione lyase family enzyme
MKLRVAHPTSRLDDIHHFYADVLRLPVVATFNDHDGFSGVVFALEPETAELEFTVREPADPVPEWSSETLLVFYQPDQTAYDCVVGRLTAAGTAQVASSNPYWERGGSTWLDPDGRRVVIYRD